MKRDARGNRRLDKMGVESRVDYIGEDVSKSAGEKEPWTYLSLHHIHPHTFMPNTRCDNKTSLR